MPLNAGRFTLHEIRDGFFGLDGGAMSGIVPRPLWGKAHHFGHDPALAGARVREADGEPVVAEPVPF